MRKSLAFFAAGGLASLAMLGGAQAKMVRYEINGQRYSYSTNNRQQVEEARRRIAAANAADAARANAEAERASNPLATVLGSPIQREAAAAQARLKQIMSASPAAEPAAGSETGGKTAATERNRVAREPAPRKEALPGFVPRAEPDYPGDSHKVAARPRPSAPAETAEKPAAPPRAKVAGRPRPSAPAETAEKPAAPPRAKVAGRPKPSAPAETAEKPAAPQSAKVAAKPKPTKESRGPAVQSVHFDPDTGIKTTVMTDGAVHEEPFELSAAASSRQGLKPAPEDVTSGLQKAGKAEPKN
jgi:hypothetical protein